MENTFTLIFLNSIIFFKISNQYNAKIICILKLSYTKVYHLVSICIVKQYQGKIKGRKEEIALVKRKKKKNGLIAGYWNLTSNFCS